MKYSRYTNRGLGVLDSGGFALAELLVVIVIIGILAVLSLASYYSFTRRERLNSLALEISGWIEQVRNQAANKINSVDTFGGCSVSFKHSISGGAGQSIATASGCDGVTQASLLIPSSLKSTYSIRSNSSSASDQTIVFTPRGMILASPALSASYEYRFILSDGRGPKRCVRISDVTGTVDIGYGSDSSLSSECASYGGL